MQLKKIGSTWISQSSFVQNEVILAQLDELDRMTHAWIEFNYSLIEA